jgi:hypothetical protein
MKGWVDNKGFKDVASALKAHRSAETMIGVPAEQRLTLPRDPTAAGAMDPIFNRLGRPEKAEGYQFQQAADKSDGEFVLWAAKTFHPLGLTQTQASSVFDAFKALVADVSGKEAVAQAAAATAEMTALKTDWGANFEKKMTLAREAAQKLGFTPEQMEALKTDTRTARLMANIGARVTEPPFAAGDGPKGGFKSPMTAEGAQTRKSQLMEDRAYVERYNKGDVNARQEMADLNEKIFGG